MNAQTEIKFQRDRCATCGSSQVVRIHPPNDWKKVKDEWLGCESCSASGPVWCQTAVDWKRRGWQWWLKLPDHVHGDLSDLTAREIQVACLVAQGHCRFDIAKILERSPKTIDAHRAKLERKIGVHDRTKLAVMLLKLGLVKLEDIPDHRDELLRKPHKKGQLCTV